MEGVVEEKMVVGRVEGKMVVGWELEVEDWREVGVEVEEWKEVGVEEMELGVAGRGSFSLTSMTSTCIPPIWGSINSCFTLGSICSGAKTGCFLLK
jgi:hypothetical protein